jgi:hypothetical protein
MSVLLAVACLVDLRTSLPPINRLATASSTRIIAVDWSGRGGRDQARHIWLCEIIDGEVRRLECGRTRTELVDHVTALADDEGSLVVGLDFVFSTPAWYLRERNALASALVMAERADSFAGLRREPDYALEGKIWA